MIDDDIRSLGKRRTCSSDDSGPLDQCKEGRTRVKIMVMESLSSFRNNRCRLR